MTNIRTYHIQCNQNQNGNLTSVSTGLRFNGFTGVGL